MFTVSIDALRSAIKSVLPLVGESYRGYGTGVFLVMQNSLWVVSGSFQSKLGGARVTIDIDEVDDLVDKFINISDLHQFLSASFSSEQVKISLGKTGQTLEFKVGRNRRSFSYDSTANIANLISFPPLSESMQIEDIATFSSIAHAAAEDLGNKLHGVFVIMDEDIELFATNGFIMGYAKTKNNLAVRTRCLIPSSFLTYVNKIYWEIHPRLWTSKNKIWMFSDDFFATCPTVVDDAYPGEKLIEIFSDLEYDIEGDVETLDLLDKLNVLGGVDKRDTHVSAVTFEFDDERGDLLLKAESKQGNGFAEFYLNSSGLTDKWIINVHAAKKIAAILKNMMASPKILFSKHEHGWMLVRPSTNDDIVFGIVPMKF